MRMQKMTYPRQVVMGLVCLAAVTSGATIAHAQFPSAEVTKEHKILKRDVGVWDAEMKLWMAGPDQDPMVSKGVERNRMLGETWILSNFTADLGGQEFKGHGQFGYDTKKKKFVGTWVENMSTNISTMEGTYDEAKGELTMFSMGIDPATGKETKSKSVSKYVDDNCAAVHDLYAGAG